MIQEGSKLPSVTFHMRERTEDGQFDWKRVQTEQLFAGRKALIIGLPGAFTPTCTNSQLPGFDDMAELFYDDCGIQDIWCTSVNDAFTMFQWSKYLNIQNVRMLPDGNGDFCRHIGMLVEKNNLGFGYRSWRYVMTVNNLKVERTFEEEGIMDNCPDDPYFYTDPGYVYEELKVGQPLHSTR